MSVGFDLGNDWSRVGVVRRGAVEVLQNDIGNRNTASMVAYTRKQRLIGDSAPPQYKSNFVNTITHMKRIIGQTYEEIRDFELPLLSFRVLSGEYGPLVEVNYQGKPEKLTVQQVTAALLGALKKTADRGLGQSTRDCVIGVPPYWTERQRLALIDAAQAADLNARLMNETTAIALNYGLLRPLPADASLKVLFVDMGACSTSAALVEFTQGKLQVLATTSDKFLGGRNFDNLLVDHFAKHIMDKYKLPVLQNAKATMKLRDECLRIKKVLSANSKVNFRVEYIMNDKDVDGQIERAQFEQLAAPVLERLFTLLNGVLKLSKVDKEQIYSLELVGGATRIPIVKKSFADWFGKDVSQTCDADESVARGCALMAAMLSSTVRVKPFEVVDISSCDNVFKWGELGKMEESSTLFPAGSVLGATKAVSLKSRSQPLEFVVFGAGESLLGRWVITGNPEPTKGAKPAKVKVTVKLEANSITTIPSAEWIETIEVEEAPDTAKNVEEKEKPDAKPDGVASPQSPQEAGGTGEKAMDVEAKGEAKPEKKKQKRTVQLSVSETKPGRMPLQLVQEIRKRELEMAAHDRLVIETHEARNALESYVLEQKPRVESDLRNYLEDNDRAKLLEELLQTEQWLEDHDETSKEEYQSRLSKLRVVSDRAQNRLNEAEKRPEFVKALEKAIVDARQWAQTQDPKFAHIKEEERKKVLDNCAQAQEWLGNELSKLQSLKPWQDPGLTSDALEKRVTQVQNFAKSVMNEPPPTPEPAPPQAGQGASQPESTGAGAASGGQQAGGPSSGEQAGAASGGPSGQSGASAGQSGSSGQQGAQTGGPAGDQSGGNTQGDEQSKAGAKKAGKGSKQGKGAGTGAGGASGRT